MSRKQPAPRRSSGFTQGVARVLILIITCILIYLCLVLPDVINQANMPVAVGEVANQDILAPYSITYESKVYTERARMEAAAAVPPVFLPPDPSIARRQLETLNSILYYISTVRNDPYATREQKLEDLEALDEIKLNPSIAAQILALNDQDWQNIDKEARRVLELVMRDTIRNENVAQIRSNLPAIIDFAFPTEQAQVVIALASPLIVPTSLYSEEQTNLAREQARATIEPISRQIIAGEVIVRRGQIIREEDLEALNIFGLAKPSNQTDQYVTNAILVGVLATLSVLYFNRRQDQDFYDPKHLSLIAIVFVIFLGLGRFLVIDRTIVPYLYPVAAFGLTIAIIYNFEFGTLLSLFLSILLTFGKNREAELTIFYLLPTMLGMLTIGRARHIGTFIGSGFVTGLLGTAVVAAFRLGDVYTDMVGLSTLVVASLVNGVISGSFALLLQYIFAQILDIPTTLQLIDISRPDHPLLQYILQNAPGSYQHSLLVANLCEQAAGAIGADRLLIRVGALFHDCGKANNPQFFVENQIKDKIDAHDDLDPATAAATIIQHVPDGIALAKKYRLPSRIIDFIREHHGTMLTVYQYSQAVAVAESSEEVDKSLFTYPGPKPQSRETAILMLADGTEARARADAPRTDEELRDLIQKSIAMYKDADQLEETDLTLKDLKIIEDSFFETLQRSYHPRIKYPQVQKKLEEQAESALAEE